MTKRIALLFAALCLCFVCCRAETVGGNTGDNYSEIEMSASLDSLTEKYGQGEQCGDYIRFGNALCAFYESGRLLAKARYFDDVREAAAFSEGNFAKASRLKYGTPLDEISALLGEGCEIMRINLSDEDEPGHRIVLAWQNARGEVLEALLELEDDVWVLFALGDVLTEETK
ncbi:MAG: hypothetical protein IKR85_04665 [Clostridia bacterium]|nr:hypothetical protein [Clostridia bacterium]